MRNNTLIGLAFLSLLLSGCETTPAAPPAIRINTIPAGADISVDGNYIGQSPVNISMPFARGESEQYGYGIAAQPMQIEAQLKGYQTKVVAFGAFHASKSEVVQPIFSANAVTKTIPGYYTFQNQITIKLYPANGYIEHPSASLDSAGIVGIGLRTEDPQLIVEVGLDKPAGKAGIKVGDRIQKVDGKDVKSLSISQLVQLIGGPVGTKVIIEIERKGEVSPKSFSLVRIAR